MVVDNPDPPGHHKRSGLHWLDLTVSICALVTSAVSIFMAYQNSNAMEDLVHANSWPFVQLSSGNSTGASEDDHTLTFNLNNAGTGPARIYGFEFTVDGHAVASSGGFINMARACCEQQYRSVVAGASNPFDAIGVIQTRRIRTTMLASNEETIAMRWTRTDRNKLLWDAIDQARQTGRIAMHACYCSVFDECWDARSNELPQRRARVCETPPPNASVAN